MFASRGRSALLAQLLLERLVICDADHASALEAPSGAGRSYRAPATVRGVEPDGGSKVERLLLAVRTGDDLPSKVDEEGALRKETAIRLCPRLAHDRASGISHRSNVGAGDVAAIDEELADLV